MIKKISVLGSTGSIGTQTLEIARYNQDIGITALAAGSNVELLEKQVREFHPKIACLWKEEAARELKRRIRDLDVKVVSGMEGLMEAACEPEAQIVVTAVVGMIGIRPTIAAMEAGKDIALANKETLVTAGHIIMPLAKEKGVKVIGFSENQNELAPGTVAASIKFDFGKIYSWILDHYMDGKLNGNEVYGVGIEEEIFIPIFTDEVPKEVQQTVENSMK